MVPMLTGGDLTRSHSASNNDFGSGMYTVTFRLRYLMVPSPLIVTHSDLREEGTELFLVIILSTNLGNVVVGAAGTAIVTITNTTGTP